MLNRGLLHIFLPENFQRNELKFGDFREQLCGLGVGLKNVLFWRLETKLNLRIIQKVVQRKSTDCGLYKRKKVLNLEN